MPSQEFYDRVRNKVLCSDGGRINNLGVSIIISEYESYREAIAKAQGVSHESAR